jgi:outer membrane protein
MIKTRLLALAVLLAAPGFVFLPASGLAQGKKPALSIAVVNVAKLLQESKAMKHVREKAKKLEKKYKADYAGDMRQLQKEQQALRKDQPNITGREFERRRQDLTRQYVNLRRKSQLQRRLLSAAYQKALGRFREELIIVVKALAVEKGYNMVLNQATTIHVAPQFEITDDVLDRLNKRLPKLKFEVEGLSSAKKKSTTKRKNKKK